MDMCSVWHSDQKCSETMLSQASGWRSVCYIAHEQFFFLSVTNYILSCNSGEIFGCRSDALPVVRIIILIAKCLQTV